ncbi:MAG: SWIM zinc finger family protein [Acidobacteriota bacterium]
MAWWRRRRRYDYSDFYPRSVPIEAKGGIKAQAKRGEFAESWWAKRWIEVLEGFDIGARLHRGRSYARSGQVLSIDLQAGGVTAQVQGSRPKPYSVKIKVKTMKEAERAKLMRAISQQAIFAAKLLAGEMPKDVESALTGAGMSLFPERLNDLDTQCSCPDWSNPCKHIAAVYYLLGEEFDRDPFLIFKLRGVEREHLTAGLGRAQAAAEEAQVTTAVDKSEAAGEPLDATPAAFWHGADFPTGWLGEVHIPPMAAALPRRLGAFPFWRGADRFLDAITPAYSSASLHAQRRLLGEE